MVIVSLAPDSAAKEVWNRFLSHAAHAAGDPKALLRPPQRWVSRTVWRPGFHHP